MSIDDSVRLSQRSDFLKQSGVSLDQVVFLAKDMSPRQYFRVIDKPCVLMDNPPPDTIHNYIYIAKILKQHGLRAPEIYDFDEQQGFALIEDFGNETYAKAIAANSNHAANLYGVAIDVIKYLENHIDSKPEDLDDYSFEKLMAETNLFMDWYWLYIFNVPASEAVKKEFYNIFVNYYKNLPKTPQTLVLRDYHLDNLMVLKGEGVQSCGLLDFQDAQWGSVLYDYISLIEDARYDVSEEIAGYCWQKVTLGLNAEQYQQYYYAARVFGLGRHLKVLGVFARYAILYKNSSKLIHIDRLWKYILKTCVDAEFNELKIWLKSYFPMLFEIK